MGNSANNQIGTPQSLNNQSASQSMFSNPQLQALMGQVASGGMSLSDALKQSGSFSGLSADQLKSQNQNIWDSAMAKDGANGADSAYSQMSQLKQENDPGALQSAFMQDLALNPTTGGQLASYGVQNNPLMSQGLGAEQQQLQTGQNQYNTQNGILSNLQNQGFNLQPQDQSLYGQEAGSIARQFGSQGNDTANSLASRGLSSSGAAGAAFSGLQGSQNEMLAQAQQSIAQQRFQNTMNQIGQQQQFMGQLQGQNNQAAGQYANTAGNYQNQAYNQNLAGIQQQNALQNSNITNTQNQQSNQQNETNEQFSQNLATSPFSQAMGALGAIGGAAGALAGPAGGAAKGIGSLFGSGGASSPAWGGAETDSTNANFMGPTAPTGTPQSGFIGPTQPTNAGSGQGYWGTGSIGSYGK